MAHAQGPVNSSSKRSRSIYSVLGLVAVIGVGYVIQKAYFEYYH